MAKRTTRDDVARLAEVSVATVSYVLNGSVNKRIPEETAKRVICAAEELGYVPNHAARTLARGRSGLIALWMPYLDSTYHAQIGHFVHKYVKASGYELVVTDGDVTRADWLSSLMSLSQGTVDGILDAGCGSLVRAYLKSTTETRTPIVSMGAFHSDEIDYVGIDMYDAVVDSVRHLLDLGLKRLAYVVDASPSFHPAETPGEQRYDAYTATIRDAQLEPEYVLVQGRTSPDAYEAMKHYISQFGCPQGLLCYNDDIAIGVHRAVLEAGLRMPDDVALVGHDGIPYTEYVTPRISTVVHPLEEMCRLGWEFLQRRMAEPSAPPLQWLLKPYLEVRASSSEPIGLSKDCRKVATSMMTIT